MSAGAREPVTGGWHETPKRHLNCRATHIPSDGRGQSVRVLCLFIAVLWAQAGQVGATATHQQFQYYANGNVHILTTPKGATTYQYDVLDRLVDEAGPAGIQHYTYDANGNRIQDGGGYLTYPANSNRIQSRYGSSPNHTYDHAGRTLTDDGQFSYTYDVRGRLKTVTRKATSTLLATYYYDYRNRRTRKVTTSPAQTIVYHYDQFDRLTGASVVSGGTPTPRTTYLYNAAVPVAQIDHGTTEKINYLSSDHLGTPRVARDAQRKVVWKWDSDAFGTTLANADPDRDRALTTVDLRFPGQLYDAESGLHHNWHRAYDPRIGRYLQSDPIGLAGGINTYAYARSNSLRYTDPTGEFTFIGGAVGGAIAGGVGTFIGAYVGTDASLGEAASAAVGGAATGLVAGALAGLCGGCAIGVFTGSAADVLINASVGADAATTKEKDCD